MPLYLLRAATAYLWLHYPWTEHIMQQCMRAGASPSICIIFSFRNSMLVFRALIGRGVIPYGRNIHNSLCRTDPWTKNFIPKKNTSNHGSYAAIASMVGRKAKKREIVVPDPDYRIPIVLLGIAGGFVYQNNLLPAAPTGLLGLLLLFQTTRVRFVFDEEALEVKVGDQLQESGENVFVGGKNRWKYSTFVNWELWWPQFPVLVYFKETQTKPEGQVHFFPVIFNGKQLYDVMLERAGPTKTSAPK